MRATNAKNFCRRITAPASLVVILLRLSSTHAQTSIPLYATVGREAAPILRARDPSARLIAVDPGTLGAALQQYSFAAVFAPREWTGQDDVQAANTAPN